jgi:hypothetical protein
MDPAEAAREAPEALELGHRAEMGGPAEVGTAALPRASLAVAVAAGVAGWGVGAGGAGPGPTGAITRTGKGAAAVVEVAPISQRALLATSPAPKTRAAIPGSSSPHSAPVPKGRHLI